MISELDNLILKFILTCKGPGIAKTFMKRKTEEVRFAVQAINTEYGTK